MSNTGGGGNTGTGAGGAGGDASGGGGEGGGGGPPVCEGYPFELTLPDNEAAAIADLATFAPNANLTWNDAHGTLSSVTNLGVELDCAGNGDDVWEAAWAVLEAHPDLFQLDRAEWAPNLPYPCSVVNDLSIANTSRVLLAGAEVHKDVLAIVVAPSAGGGVTLNGVNAFYLPVLEPEQIQGCEDLPDATLEGFVRQQTYDYVMFSQCVFSGAGTYTPQPNDVIEWDQSFWDWDDGTGSALATKKRAGRLIIHEDNWTEELMDSDLNCPHPDPASNERVLGYTIYIDPITGELTAMPGIGCIVC